MNSLLPHLADNQRISGTIGDFFEIKSCRERREANVSVKKKIVNQFDHCWQIFKTPNKFNINWIHFRDKLESETILIVSIKDQIDSRNVNLASFPHKLS